MKTCPSCGGSVEDFNERCPACGWQITRTLFGGGKTILVKPAARPKISVEVDLGITVDRTGSSKAFAIGIPLTVEIVLKALTAKARSVRVWVQSHGDYDDGQDLALITNGEEPERALSDIRGIEYGGGGDPPEHHLDAIMNLANIIPWTSDPSRARGALLALMTADSKASKLGHGSAQEIGRKLRERGILTYLVCEPTRTLNELAEAAGGLVFPISNSPDPAQLQSIAAAVAASIIQTVTRGGTVPMTAVVATER